MLNVTRPAVSQQIRNLESHLGEPLMQRGRCGVVLTVQGEALAHTALTTFASIAFATERFTTSRSSRVLHITTTPMFASGFLVPRLASFRAAHPGIELMLNPTSELIDLNLGGVDAAIRYGNGDWEGVESELLFKGSFAVVGATSLVGNRKVTKPAEILDYPIFQELGSTEFSDWMDRQGLEPGSEAKITRMPGNLLLDELRRGEGIVATVPRFIEKDLNEGSLSVLFEDRLDSGYYAVTRPDTSRAPLRTFLNWLDRSVDKRI
ncbi:MAG: LysR family glycine cleavage system transcriptional activator [Saprospiraceae bacterium]|jgi:LysR family glycine cleavage system transcriptional activator